MYRLEQGESYLPDKQTSLEDRYYNNPSFQEEYSVNDPEVQNAATKIQAKFRGHKARQDVEKIRRDNKDIFDTDRQELGYDTGRSATPKDDDHHHQKSPRISSARSEKHEEHETKVEVEEDQPFTEELTEEEKEEQERAARSIQARFRGQKLRKNVGQERSSPVSASDRDHLSDRPQQHDSDNEKVSSRPSSRLSGKHDSDRDDHHKTGEQQDTNRPRLEREPTQLSEDFERHTQVPRDSDFEREHQTNLDTDEIDMNDPNLDKAATRIQASFRGYKTRKELGTGGTGNEQNPHTSMSSHGHDEYDHADTKILSSSVEGNKEPEYEDDNSAAIKIQAAYRGYRVRKDMEK